MNNYIYLFLVFFTCGIVPVYSMEEPSSDEESDLFFVDRKKSTTKFAFDKDAKNSSSWFTNSEHRCKASTINRSQHYLQQLLLVFKMELSLETYEDKLTHFGLLKDLLSRYLQASTLNNPEGDCLDSDKARELKIKIQDIGSILYFEHALDCKIRAEEKYFQIYPAELDENEQQEELRKILNIARMAHSDFLQAYRIDNNHDKALLFADEVDSFISKIENEIYPLTSYTSDLDITQKRYLLTQEAYKQILSAPNKQLRQGNQLNMKLETISEDEDPAPTRRRRSRTLEVFRKGPETFMKIVLPRRRSFDENEKKEITELPENLEDKKDKLLRIEQAENECFEAIKGFLEAFDLYNEKHLLDKVQNLLDQVHDLDFERALLTPHGFITKPEIGEYCKKLEAGRKLLQEAGEKSSSSSD